MSSNKHIEPSWIVEGSKYYYDPETKSNVLRELFDNEDKAMKFAAEKSLKCQSDSTVINVTVNADGRASLIAQYKKGEEQFEKQALESIIKDCRMFAVCAGKSGPSPFTFILFLVGVFLAWAYGIVALSNLFDNYLVGSLAASVAIGLVCAYYHRQAYTQGKYYTAEAEKWARQIAYRVSTTDRVLLGRIFTTMRENPVKMPFKIPGLSDE